MALIMKLSPKKPGKKGKHHLYEHFKQGVMDAGDLVWDTVKTAENMTLVGTEVITDLEPIHKVAVEPDAHVSLTEDLTAEYLTLHTAYEKYQMKSIIKRMDDIKKALHQYANENMDKDKPAVFACDTGEVEFSERGKVAVVKNAMDLVRDLIEKFDHEVAFSVVDIAITPLRKILGEIELKAYLDEQPGSRTLRAVRHG